MARAIDSSDLLALVDALADGRWQSGEALAAQFGITRAGLAKRLLHLRDWGLEIQSRNGRGYRLSQSIERLNIAQIQNALSPDFNVRVEALVDSTNRMLMDAEPSNDPQALLAEFQSAGKGRRGRSWQSPFGSNLYVSMAWTFALWPRDLSALSLAVGVLCAETLASCGVANVKLKWPNDLWVGGRKLGGILIEQRGESGGSCRVIVGIGINVAMQHAQAAQIDQAWTTANQVLLELGKPALSRSMFAGALLQRLYDCLNDYAVSGFASYAQKWRGLDALRDCAVHVPDNAALRGTGRGIDDSGAFQIETEEGLRQVHAGEVSLRLA